MSTKQNRHTSSTATAGRARRAWLAGAAVAGLVAPLGVVSAEAAVTPISAPRNIEVFADLDIVGVAGFTSPIVVEVWRNGVKVGTSGAPVMPAPDPEAGTFMEVNHDAGMCWSGHTPDIVPGDEIRVVTNEGEDAEVAGEFMRVSTLTTSEPKIVALDDDGLFNDLVMKGRARTPDGDQPIPMADLSVEIVQPAFRDAGVAGWDRRVIGADSTGVMPDADAVFPNGGTGVLAYDEVGPGNEDGSHWTATWKNLPSPLEQLALSGEHVVASVERPGGDDGVGITLMSPHDASGGAPGCPPGISDAVSGTSPANVNLAAANAGGDLVVSGVSYNASAVSVTIDDSDNDPSDVITIPGVINNPASLAETAEPVDPVRQTWRAAVPISQVVDSDLGDGELVASAVFDRVLETRGERIVQVPRQEPALDEAGNALPDTDESLLRDADGNPVPAEDDAGEPMLDPLGAPVYLREVMDDVTEVFFAHAAAPISGGSHTFLKDLEAPASPVASFPGGEYYGTQWLTLSPENDFEEVVRYRIGTGDVATPSSASPEVTGQIALSTTQTVRARSYDRAGNPSPVISETYTILRPTAAGAPAAPSGTAGDGEVSLTWEAPSETGSSAVTGYRVRYETAGLRPREITVEDTLSTVVDGLTNDVAYRFSVAAVNDAGVGEFSPLSEPVTPFRPDTEAPVLTSQFPAPGSTAVATGTNLRVQFSEPVNNVTSTTLLLRNVTSNQLVPSAVTLDGATLQAVISPLAPLPTDSRFEVEVTPDVTDLAGNPVQTFRWSFATNQAPVVAGVNPTAGSKGVRRGITVLTRLSEPVKGVNARTVRLVRVADGRAVAAVVKYQPSLRRIVVDPRKALKARSAYRVQLRPGITDLAGNPLASRSWTFRTGRR